VLYSTTCDKGSTRPRFTRSLRPRNRSHPQALRRCP
jgi:hypothetical protein